MLKNNNCKIIAIEGIDGSGKTLQYNMLTNSLKQLGKRCLTLSFPNYDGFFGQEIGYMLSGKYSVRADNVDPKSMALWYAMDRWKAFQMLDTTGYDFLLLNRYILSNAVYQSLRVEAEKQAEFVRWVFNLENVILGLPNPDTYIIMDIDRETSVKNIKQKGFRNYTGDEADVYEKSHIIMTKARQSYLEYSHFLSNVNVIACVKDGEMLLPNDIHSKVMEMINMY